MDNIKNAADGLIADAADGLIADLAFSKKQSAMLWELMEIPQSRKISRIKVIRTHTGMNLKDAKAVADRVNSLIPDFGSTDAEKSAISEAQRLTSALNKAADRNEDLKEDLDQAVHDYQKLVGGFKGANDALNVALTLLRTLTDTSSLEPEFADGLIKAIHGFVKQAHVVSSGQPVASASAAREFLNWFGPNHVSEG